jgi:hypothetical protein
MIRKPVLVEEAVCRLDRVEMSSRSPELTDARKAEGKPEISKGTFPKQDLDVTVCARGGTRRSLDVIGRWTRAAIVKSRLGSGGVAMRRWEFVAQGGFR